MRRKILTALIPLFIVFLLFGARGADAGEPLFDVYIPFEEGQAAWAETPAGEKYDLGKVITLPKTTRWPSYTASAWGTAGSVTASAVNALHILLAVEDDKGRTMSVVPKETIAPAAGPGASLVLDSPAGHGFFGAWSPPVGTTVLVISSDKSIRPLRGATLPERGETLLLRVDKAQHPYMIEFENRPGGRVTAWGSQGPSLAGRVIRPVGGTGRFEGTLYSAPGRIRAAHSGVIDVSTSPDGMIGGFQIIPWEHALESKEMQGAWELTQWMIVGPADGLHDMGGTYPLFHGGLIPGPASGEALWDIWSTYGRRPLVLVRQDGGPWGKIPVVSGRVDDALLDITHLRIYFPQTDEPLQ